MATKIQVLNDVTYQQYIQIGMLLAARQVNAEVDASAKGQARTALARQILTSPSGLLGVFMSLCIVSFDTSTWEVLTETQKISGAQSLCYSVFNEAGNIY